MSLIHSHLNWGAPVFGASKLSGIKHLESLQNKAIRNLVRAKYNAHTNELYKSLNILKVSDIIKLSRGLLVMKFKKDLIPNTLHIYFKYSNEQGDRRIRDNQENFHIPSTFKQTHEIFPIPEMFKSWNRLPHYLKSATKLTTFRSDTKNYLLDKYDTDCHKLNCYPCKQQTSLNYY